MKVDTFLEHYGVKGMRWGVRGKRSNASSFIKNVLAKSTTFSASAAKAGKQWLSQRKNRRILGYVMTGVEKGLKESRS